jgi:hypothetical protein
MTWKSQLDEMGKLLGIIGRSLVRLEEAIKPTRDTQFRCQRCRKMSWGDCYAKWKEALKHPFGNEAHFQEQLGVEVRADQMLAEISLTFDFP